MRIELKIALIILVMLFFGFLRENFFFHLNFLINKSTQGSEHHVPTIWNWMQNWQIPNLQILKWVATLFFSLVFLALTLLLLRVIFPSQDNQLLILISFGSVMLLSMFAILSGQLIPSISEKTYYFSRWLMGSLQSPLFPGILTLFIYYNNQIKKNKTD